jgi:hypothetical protein
LVDKRDRTYLVVVTLVQSAVVHTQAHAQSKPTTKRKAKHKKKKQRDRTYLAVVTLVTAVGLRAVACKVPKTAAVVALRPVAAATAAAAVVTTLAVLLLRELDAKEEVVCVGVSERVCSVCAHKLYMRANKHTLLLLPNLESVNRRAIKVVDGVVGVALIVVLNERELAERANVADAAVFLCSTMNDSERW